MGEMLQLRLLGQPEIVSQELENKAEMVSALRYLGHGARVMGREAITGKL